MTVIFAPSDRARRVLIAVLAFLLAIGFAIAASVVPAQAGNGDDKLYEAELVSSTGTSAHVRVTNLSGTDTQKMGGIRLTLVPVDGSGSFSGLTLDSVSAYEASWTGSASGNVVLATAIGGGNRVAPQVDPPSGTVDLIISWSAADPGDYIVQVDVDQQATGTFKKGNLFEGNNLDLTIAAVCAAQLCGEGFEANLAQCNDVVIDGELIPCELADGGDTTVNADVIVTYGDNQTIILVVRTTDGDAGPPGSQREVEFFPSGSEDGDGQLLEQCGKKGADPVTNCFHVNRISDGNIEYTVIFTGYDIRYRFR